VLKRRPGKTIGVDDVNKHAGKIAVAAGLILLAGVASANGGHDWHKDGYFGGKPDTCISEVSDHSCTTGGSGGWGVVSAPEIDPAATISAVTLLLGGLLVLRGRKANE